MMSLLKKVLGEWNNHMEQQGPTGLDGLSIEEVDDGLKWLQSWPCMQEVVFGRSGE